MTSPTELILLNLELIFNQRNAERRRASLRSLWSPKGTFFSSEGVVEGATAIDRIINDLLKRYPEFDFAADGQADDTASGARLCWTFGVPHSSPAFSGLDIICVEDGQIIALYRFLDGAAM